MNQIKTTKSIGTLTGKLLVFGGVYSNLQALKKMMQIGNELNISPENIICTGDVVGYCAEAESCVQEIMNWGIQTIAGNVEIQLREGEENCGCDFKAGSRCNTFSEQWYSYAKAQLSESSIEWMLDLPNFIQFEFAKKKGIVLHGSYHKTAEFIFKSTPWKKKEQSFKDTNSNLILSGHCGLPFNHLNNGKYWLNAGVIGMPANNGSTKVWYMILDTSVDGQLVFSHHDFSYNHKKAAQLMNAKKLTPEYALTLQTGIWDNCDILPEVETNASANAILF